MINFLDKSNISKLIEIENFSLSSTLDIQKNLNKQLLLFMKNFTANIRFSSDISPTDKSFSYLSKITKALNKSNANMKSLQTLINLLNKLDVSDEDLEEKVNYYNEKFTKNIASVYKNTELIQKLIYKLSNTDLSDLPINETTEKKSDTISSEELSNCFIENTLVISEIQKKVILPYDLNTIKDILLENKKKYRSIQNVIDKLYTKPIKHYKLSAIARFKEAYKLIREKENGSKFKALELAFELFGNYNLNPAIITACKSLDELDIYLACLEENTLNEFDFFDIKYEVPPAISKNNLSPAIAKE